MTTIVYDGEVIAADGRVSCSGRIVTDSYNKLVIIKKIMIDIVLKIVVMEEWQF